MTSSSLVPIDTMTDEEMRIFVENRRKRRDAALAEFSHTDVQLPRILDERQDKNSAVVTTCPTPVLNAMSTASILKEMMASSSIPKSMTDSGLFPRCENDPEFDDHETIVTRSEDQLVFPSTIGVESDKNSQVPNLPLSTNTTIEAGQSDNRDLAPTMTPRDILQSSTGHVDPEKIDNVARILNTIWKGRNTGTLKRLREAIAVVKPLFDNKTLNYNSIIVSRLLNAYSAFEETRLNKLNQMRQKKLEQDGDEEWKFRGTSEVVSEPRFTRSQKPSVESNCGDDYVDGNVETGGHSLTRRRPIQRYTFEEDQITDSEEELLPPTKKRKEATRSSISIPSGVDKSGTTDISVKEKTYFKQHSRSGLIIQMKMIREQLAIMERQLSITKSQCDLVMEDLSSCED